MIDQAAHRARSSRVQRRADPRGGLRCWILSVVPLIYWREGEGLVPLSHIL